MSSDEVTLHRPTAPCECGMPALTIEHLERAQTDAVCEARVQDVRLLHQLLREQRKRVPEARPAVDNLALADLLAEHFPNAAAFVREQQSKGAA